MSKRIKVVLTIAVLAATWAIPGIAAEGRQTPPKPPDKQMLRADQVKQLLLLMDTDKELAPPALRARHFADMGK
jgi:hypothetical protein